MNGPKVNRIVAALIFVFTTIVYIATVAPTVSFWDCGEFIATSYRMSVPHPPGSPLYLLVGRMFTMMPFHPDIGFRVNMISVLSSSITIALLYLSIVQIIREWKGKLESKEDWFTAIFSGILGSLSFAFTYSFWFNSTEAEVYAASMLFTSLLVWLSLKWAEKSHEVNNEKYLLMISYIIGLAIAVHLLNILALPFVAMMFYYKRYNVNPKTFSLMVLATIGITFVFYPGIVKWMPRIAEVGGFFSLALVFALITGIAAWAVMNKRHLLSFAFLSITLIMIGYSSYGVIYIRSGLNPTIDENNPENIENFLKYINREQYGEHDPFDRTGVWKSSQNGNRYSSVGEFFWDYQVNRMYIRYFLWQFVGMDDLTGRVDFNQLYALPLLLGLIGMVFHFRSDPRHALAVLALFLATGLAIILYLNQPDPQPRERDYSYVGSFFAFSIWIGLGYAGIIQLIKESLAEKKKKMGMGIMAGIFILMIVMSPVQLLAKNYHISDRSGNYVAWDYSYNMLMSCEPDAIIFTNGDNDTFPLWYLQEVEKVRRDVRIVNLSLLNTDWYIQQLRDIEPKVPMRMADAQIEQVSPIRWDKKELSLEVPENTANQLSKEYQSIYSDRPVTVPKSIKFELGPTIRFQNMGFLRTQDWMILNILAANRWKKPVYFATTVPQSNLMGGLREYMRMEGAVLRLVPFKNWEIDPKRIERNLIETYKYRNLDDPSVYYNPGTIALLQNYRTAFVQLGSYYTRENTDKQKLKTLLTAMEERIPSDTIPWTAEQLENFYLAYKILTKPALLDSMIQKDMSLPRMSFLGQFLLSSKEYDSSIRILEKANSKYPGNPELLGALISAYDFAGRSDEAITELEKWVEMNPTDRTAQSMLESLRKRSEADN